MSGTATKIEIVIRFSDGSISDLPIPVANESLITATYLRKTIRSLKSEDVGRKRLRLIYGGKVLNEQTNFIKDIFEPRIRLSDEDESPLVIYIHCLLGDELTRAELAKEDQLETQQQVSTAPAPVGFDRLLQQGFSQQDVEDMRREFTQLYGNLSTRSGESPDIRQLEDRWIDSTVNNEVDEFPTMNMNLDGMSLGGNEDLLIGLLVGCLLGVIALFFLKDNELFSKRQRMAVIAGVVVNYSFALVRQWA